MASEQTNISGGSATTNMRHENTIFFENDNDEGVDEEIVCSDDSDEEGSYDNDDDSATNRKRRKKERKVPLSDEESERRRVLANSQERERMNRLNRALANLRRVLPAEMSSNNRRLSKIRTLRLAASYIQGLSKMLAEYNQYQHQHSRNDVYPGQILQPQYPCYPPPPPPPPYPYPTPALFRSPALATPHHFVPGDISADDEGYLSYCSFNDPMAMVAPEHSFPGESSGVSFNTSSAPRSCLFPNHVFPGALIQTADNSLQPSYAAMSSSSSANNFLSSPPWQTSTPVLGSAGNVNPVTGSASGSYEEDAGVLQPSSCQWDSGFGTQSLGVPSDVYSPQSGRFVAASTLPFASPVSPTDCAPAQFSSTPLAHVQGGRHHHRLFHTPCGKLGGGGGGGCSESPKVQTESSPSCALWSSATCVKDK